MTSQEKEKLEVLNGDRGNKQDAAVRLKHIQALLSAVPNDPTGDVAADVRLIFAALNAMRAALR